MNHSRPGTLVPRATIVMAVTESLILLKHPKCEATSPIVAVSNPMPIMDPKNAGYPLYLSEDPIPSEQASD